MMPRGGGKTRPSQRPAHGIGGMPGQGVPGGRPVVDPGFQRFPHGQPSPGDNQGQGNLLKTQGFKVMPNGSTWVRNEGGGAYQLPPVEPGMQRISEGPGRFGMVPRHENVMGNETPYGENGTRYGFATANGGFRPTDQFRGLGARIARASSAPTAGTFAHQYAGGSASSAPDQGAIQGYMSDFYGGRTRKRNSTFGGPIY